LVGEELGDELGLLEGLKLLLGDPEDFSLGEELGLSDGDLIRLSDGEFEGEPLGEELG
jgi:hypothetical protein